MQFGEANQQITHWGLYFSSQNLGFNNKNKNNIQYIAYRHVLEDMATNCVNVDKITQIMENFFFPRQSFTPTIYI